MLGEVKIVVSEKAVSYSIGARKFPASRHRSKRIHKKLVKRFGGEYHIVVTPMCYEINGTLVMHPKLYEEMKNRVKV